MTFTNEFKKQTVLMSLLQMTKNCSNKTYVRYFGLTQDPSNGNYMLVMDEMDINLRKYLQQNHNQLKIIYSIIKKFYFIHVAIQHSGKILYSQYRDDSIHNYKSPQILPILIKGLFHTMTLEI